MLTIFIVVIACISCGKKCPCPDETILPVFMGYDSSQVDTIKIIRFEKGSNFTRAVDSVELTPVNSIIFTSAVAMAITGKDINHRVAAGYDWQITNPFDNKSFQISAIEVQQTETNCGRGLFSWDKQPCVSPNQSFKVNGSPYTIDRTFITSGILIRK